MVLPHKGFQDLMTIKHDQVIRTLLTLNIVSQLYSSIVKLSLIILNNKQSMYNRK